MQPTICARCHKNMAVVFITKIENGHSKNEGLCLKCAKDLHIQPVDDMISRLGLTDDDIDGLSGEMMEALSSGEGLFPVESTDGDEDDDGKTATFPFLNRLFNNMQGNENPPPQGAIPPAPERPPREKEAPGGTRAARKNFWRTTASP